MRCSRRTELAEQALHGRLQEVRQEVRKQTAAFKQISEKLRADKKFSYQFLAKPSSTPVSSERAVFDHVLEGVLRNRKGLHDQAAEVLGCLAPLTALQEKLASRLDTIHEQHAKDKRQTYSMSESLHCEGLAAICRLQAGPDDVLDRDNSSRTSSAVMPPSLALEGATNEIIPSCAQPLPPQTRAQILRLEHFFPHPHSELHLLFRTSRGNVLTLDIQALAARRALSIDILHSKNMTEGERRRLQLHLRRVLVAHGFVVDQLSFL